MGTVRPEGHPVVSGHSQIVNAHPAGVVRPKGHPEVIRHPMGSQWTPNGYIMVNGCTMGIR